MHFLSAISLLALGASAMPASLVQRDANVTVSANATVSANSTSSSSPNGTSIEFEHCSSDGNVSSIWISPCEGGSGTKDSPCQFTYGRNYTIDLEFVSYIGVDQPRGYLTAFDTENNNATHYPYSGQSFNGCTYTDCPIVANKTSTYKYELKTLKSPFDKFEFNATKGVDGPSFLCASFPAVFNLA